MLFFPYKPDVELQRWPVLTVCVALLCIAVFIQQQLSASAHSDALESYCTETTQRSIETIARYLPDDLSAHPCLVLLQIHRAADHNAEIRQLAAESSPIPFYQDPVDGQQYIASVLREQYSSFARRVPRDLSDSLVYDPRDIRFDRMLTSTVSHGGWGHLIGNLLFFYAFAAAVEVIAGYALYSSMLIALAVATSLAYSYSVIGSTYALPTLGLSGVVMGMIAFLAVVMPTLGIRCFFWFLLFIRRFSLPSLLLAAWYVGWDLYDLNARSDTGVNYVAHVSGAATGALMGLLFRLFKRDYLDEVRPRGA